VPYFSRDISSLAGGLTPSCETGTQEATEKSASTFVRGVLSLLLWLNEGEGFLNVSILRQMAFTTPQTESEDILRDLFVIAAVLG